MQTVLAQLVDLLPGSMWGLIFAAGLGLPAVGWIASVFLYGPRWRRGSLAALFYVLALPLALFAFVPSGSSELGGCLLLILMTVGIVLGLGLFATPAPPRRKPFDGRCARCGYDLRATPQRCPECGQVPWYGPVW